MKSAVLFDQRLFAVYYYMCAECSLLNSSIRLLADIVDHSRIGNVSWLVAMTTVTTIVISYKGLDGLTTINFTIMYRIISLLCTSKSDLNSTILDNNVLECCGSNNPKCCYSNKSNCLSLGKLSEVWVSSVKQIRGRLSLWGDIDPLCTLVTSNCMRHENRQLLESEGQL